MLNRLHDRRPGGKKTEARTSSATTLAWCLVLVCATALVTGCDRGIGPYDPDEQASQPNLDRIYPEGARAAKGPAAAGPMNPAAPAGRGAPSLEPSGAGAGAPLGETIRGTVTIADEFAAGAPQGGLLFVIARRQGQPNGPPLAVVRAENPRFPFDFEVGQAQVMIPSMRFEGEIALSARLDGDGNAMTEQPGDLAGEITNPLSPGSSGIDLTLDQKL
ncbi:MAG: hypothetical protein QF570_18935 [Myxococcota bacterium]|jgi:hypothetical protein|nr:hypothetical protein [Myxococcota bacterium]